MRKRLLSTLLAGAMALTMLSGMTAGATDAAVWQGTLANDSKEIGITAALPEYYGTWKSALPMAVYDEKTNQTVIAPVETTFAVVKASTDASGKPIYTIPSLISAEAGEWSEEDTGGFTMFQCALSYNDYSTQVADGERPVLYDDGSPVYSNGEPMNETIYKDVKIGQCFQFEDGMSVEQVSSLDSATRKKIVEMQIKSPKEVAFRIYDESVVYSPEQAIGSGAKGWVNLYLNFVDEKGQYFGGALDLLILTETDINDLKTTGKLQNYGFDKYTGDVDFASLKKLVESGPISGAATESTTPTAPTSPTAKKATASVAIDDNAQAFDAYEIGGNNYFKLRDVAKVLSGTDKQFEVTWDSEKQAINLLSGKPYTSVGGELTAGTGSAGTTAKASTASIYLNGNEVKLTAYEIGGNNYFKLRDLGKTFDFGIGWNDTSKTISVDTSTGYTE